MKKAIQLKQGVKSARGKRVFAASNGSANLPALKRAMESAKAAFFRIPDECDLDWTECRRRIKRMCETKIRYHAAAGIIK